MLFLRNLAQELPAIVSPAAVGATTTFPFSASSIDALPYLKLIGNSFPILVADSGTALAASYLVYNRSCAAPVPTVAPVPAPAPKSPRAPNAPDAPPSPCKPWDFYDKYKNGNSKPWSKWHGRRLTTDDPCDPCHPANRGRRLTTYGYDPCEDPCNPQHKGRRLATYGTDPCDEWGHDGHDDHWDDGHHGYKGRRLNTWWVDKWHKKSPPPPRWTFKKPPPQKPRPAAPTAQPVSGVDALCRGRVAIVASEDLLKVCCSNTDLFPAGTLPAFGRSWASFLHNTLLWAGSYNQSGGAVGKVRLRGSDPAYVPFIQ